MISRPRGVWRSPSRSTCATSGRFSKALDRLSERDRLERLTTKLDPTKSDVLRRGLEALEGQLSDPERHPVLGIIGMVSTAHAPGIDVARSHDEYLAALEAASWSSRRRVRGGQDSE